MTELRITHTHAEGTLLEGSSKGDGVWDIVRNRGFRYSGQVGIYIRGSRDRDAKMHLINAAAEALRAAGHDVTIDIDNQFRPTAVREADLAERAEDRAERLNDRAQRAAGRADAATAAAHRVSDHIPLGQPVLVGHHSEGKHRRALDKIDTKQRLAVDEGRYADDLAHRAAAVVANVEHRHNPRVTMRRIERLEVDLRLATRNGRPLAPIKEEIAHWRGVMAQLAEAGEFVAWTREDFQKGDQVRSRGRWHNVRRVNAKSVSVPWIVGTMSTGVESKHSDTIPWDDVTGRRRDGLQWDTPHGEPWPVEQAQQVTKWMALVRSVTTGSHNDEARALARNVRFALRITLGLDPLASEAEVQAFGALTEHDGPVRRALAVACLAVYKRLDAGERVPDVVASTEAFTQITPTWTMPVGEPEHVRVDALQKGDIVAGVVNRQGGVERYFAGPVDNVVLAQGEEYSGERFIGYATVLLTTGEERQFKPWTELAVHRAVSVNPQEA